MSATDPDALASVIAAIALDPTTNAVDAVTVAVAVVVTGAVDVAAAVFFTLLVWVVAAAVVLRFFAAFVKLFTPNSRHNKPTYHCNPPIHHSQCTL
jgi:hypothetical protein